jgi:hypothetical protein
MVKLGASDFNGGMHDACFNGHLDVVLYLIELGADDWARGLHGAYVGKQPEMMTEMYQRGAPRDTRLHRVVLGERYCWRWDLNGY